MHRTFPQEPEFKRSTRGRGHEATGEPSEGGSSSEEEEESADRGTGESGHWMDVECLTVEMETDCSSFGKLYGPGKKAEKPKSDPRTGKTVLRQDKTTQKTLLSPLPSIFMSPIYKEVTGPPFRVTKVAALAEQTGSSSSTPATIVTKKKGNFTPKESTYAIPKIPERIPEPSKIARPAVFSALARNSKCSTIKSPPEAPRKPAPRGGIVGGTPPCRKEPETSPLQTAPPISAANAAIEGSGEVKEKLVYVVEEKGKNVTKVETDLFTLNEILTIKKDLLELSEFAKKLKKLKQTHRELGNDKSEDGLCQCEPTAQILKEVNKRIEALEVRQEELEKVSECKFGNKKDAETGTLKTVDAKTSSSALPNSPEKPKAPEETQPKKETCLNCYESYFPKAELFVSRADSFSKASDIFSELLDIKSQLQKFEQKQPVKECPKEEREEVSLEDPANSSERKNRPIAVFTSKTFILSPENYGKKEALGKAGEDVNGLLKECSRKLEGIPGEEKSGEVVPKCRKCSRRLDERDFECQEPQKNRATETELRLSKKGSSSAHPSNGPSSGECFASPSGRFFAWVKKSKGRLKGNVRREAPRPKVLQRTAPGHSWSTSASSSFSEVFEEPVRRPRRHKLRKRNPDPVLARVTRSRSELDSGVCVWDRSPRKYRGKRGGRFPSKSKTHRDAYKIRRRDPRLTRHGRYLESTSSSSYSVFLDRFDFEETSTSSDRCEWNERIVSCGGDNFGSRKTRTGREEEKARREEMRQARERKMKKAKKIEKRPNKRMPRQKKGEEEGMRHHKKERRQSPQQESRDCFKPESKDSLGVYKKYAEDKRKSETSTEKPNDDRFSFKNFLKSFSWLYSRLGSSTPFAGEDHEDKKEHGEGKHGKELRKEKSDCWEDYDDESGGTSRSNGPGACHRRRQQRNYLPEFGSDHINNCDCIRAYLETQMQKKLEALMRLQKSSGVTTEATSESSNGDCQILRQQKGIYAKGENQKEKNVSRKGKKHEKKKRIENKYRQDEPLCRKCRAYYNVMDNLGEKTKASILKINPEKMTSPSDSRDLKKEGRNRSDYSPIFSFLYQLCKNKQRHSKGMSELPVKKRQESKTCFILPEEEEELRRNKMKRFCCTRCGRKMRHELDDPEGDGTDDQVGDSGRRSGSEVSRRHENPSNDTPSFDEENERKYKKRKRLKHHGRGEKDALWRRERRKRKKKEKHKNKDWSQRSLPTDFLFLRECPHDRMDGTSEKDDKDSISLEGGTRKNLRDRLSSIHSLWRSLQRWRGKGTHHLRHRLGMKPGRSSSRLDITFSDEREKESWPRRDSPHEQDEHPSVSKRKAGRSKKKRRDQRDEKRRRRREE